MNMFKKVKASSVAGYIASLPAGRREELEAVDRFIRKTVPGLKVHFATNMLGYGSFKYSNAKKELLDWPILGLASQKNYLSLYVCSMDERKYLAEKFKKDLGKASVGKSCISFKKLEDLDLKVLAKVLKLAQENPGFRR